MLETASSVALEDLCAVLDQLPTGCSKETIAENLDLVREISHPDSVVALLDGILADDTALEAIAARSYPHVNHFDKIVLVDSDTSSGYRLTLHLWRPPYTADELEDEIIHSHRFSFWSAILTGDLISENFDVAADGTHFRKYSYTPEKRTKTNFYRFRGDATLRQTEDSEQGQGTVYYLPYEQIHRVLLPRHSMTCTLVLRGPRERDHSDVYNTSYPATDTEAANQVFTAAELAERLVALRARVVARLGR